MLRDGRYAAWFRTSHGEGTGIVYLLNGRISGGDSIFTYSGSYEVDDERFTAALTTKRHAAGPPTLFGIDEVNVKLSGRFNATTAWCSGTAEQVPDLAFEATLFPNREPSPEPGRTRVTSGFDAGRLPRAPDNRYRARSPFERGGPRV